MGQEGHMSIYVDPDTEIINNLHTCISFIQPFLKRIDSMIIIIYQV